MVVILSEKDMLPPDSLPQLLPPPPPYPASSSSSLVSPPPFPGRRTHARFSSLPSHILLYIVHQTMPQSDGVYDGEGKVELQRKVLYWMTLSLRLVNRSFYIACMHVLRSTYLPAYSSMIKPPYSSDPFPFSTSGYSPYSSNKLTAPINSEQRETQVLDLFLSVKVREDVWADDTELHLEREESFKDLFDMMQPRSRLEDLIRSYGVQAGVVSVSTRGNSVVCSSPSSASPSRTTFGACITSSSSASQQPKPKRSHKLPFNSLSVTFSPRSVGLVHSSKGVKRTIVQVNRERDEKLEVSAKRIVKELGQWLEEAHS
ncbi:hypothetical protein SCHPADRAFT_899521 [Schizopora paradoxa]|uniref:Uncharacterized protein n=1 Tax=Schizopora paradoxa TaxID=27342 RepID=A0A0H2SAJ5_9AGAM|nr:hypothetical protein SCHPADRAFT_899521 [Schizopora paradoxa]